MYSLLHYRIPFSEVDAMGIVHHSNHARYFERGRVDFLRLIGLPYTEVMKEGMHFPLTGMSMQFKRPLRFDDLLVVETKIAFLSRTRLNFTYRILCADDGGMDRITSEAIPGKALVTGITEHCCVNNDGRPIEIGEKIYQRLQQFYTEVPT